MYTKRRDHHRIHLVGDDDVQELHCEPWGSLLQRPRRYILCPVIHQSQHFNKCADFDDL